jgi:large subunit ribosomal protein L21e
MAQRTGRFRFKTRHKLQKKARNRGKFPINKILSTFDIGEKVRVMQEPSQHKGMPHPRFKNVVGVIKRKQGSAYLVQLKDLKKIKQVLAKAVHLRKLQN